MLWGCVEFAIADFLLKFLGFFFEVNTEQPRRHPAGEKDNGQPADQVSADGGDRNIAHQFLGLIRCQRQPLHGESHSLFSLPGLVSILSSKAPTTE